jgi:glycine betaine/proline transport system permease protein
MDQHAIFPDWHTPVRDGTNRLVDWLVTDFGDRFEAVSESLLQLLLLVEQGLRSTPPGWMLAAVAALAFLVSRHVVFAMACTAGLWLVGALGQWTEAMQSLALVLVSVAVCLLIGVPLGLASGRSTSLRRALAPVLDLMQTIPSFVYLIPAAMLFGLGKVPAILATVVYAAPPLVRLTDLGIRQVDTEAIDAARAFGATRAQLLRKVLFPLALPSIMQGINQATMMALAMVVVASMIGARGVGETVLVGLQRNDPGLGLIGGLVIVILAILIDRLLQAAARGRAAGRGAWR